MIGHPPFDATGERAPKASKTRTVRNVDKLADILPRPIEVSREFVVLTGLQMSQQLIDRLAHLSEFRNERLPVHYREISRYIARCKSHWVRRAVLPPICLFFLDRRGIPAVGDLS
jgi:hypothetical protein